MADGELNVDSLITRLLEGESGPGRPRRGEVPSALLPPPPTGAGGNPLSRPRAAAEERAKKLVGRRKRAPGTRPGVGVGGWG